MSHNENGPRGGDPETRSNDLQAANGKPKTSGQRGRRHVSGQMMLPFAYSCAYASLYAPAGRRHFWWLAYRCPFGDGGHFARVRTEQDAEGVRRSGCGRLVWIVVARTYRGEARNV